MCHVHEYCVPASSVDELEESPVIWSSPAPHRSTFRHSTFPFSVHAFQVHADPSSARSYGRPDRVASSPKDAPLTMNQSDAQDGRWTCDVWSLTMFHSFQNLSHAVCGCSETVNNCAPISRLTCRVTENQQRSGKLTLQQTSVVQWEVGR